MSEVKGNFGPGLVEAGRKVLEMRAVGRVSLECVAWLVERW